jgi:hypothetical protein
VQRKKIEFNENWYIKLPKNLGRKKFGKEMVKAVTNKSISRVRAKRIEKNESCCLPARFSNR